MQERHAATCSLLRLVCRPTAVQSAACSITLSSLTVGQAWREDSVLHCTLSELMAASLRPKGNDWAACNQDF